MMNSEIFGTYLSEVAYMFGTRSSTNSLTGCSLVILIPEFLSGAHKFYSNDGCHAEQHSPSIKQVSLYPSSHSLTVLTASYLSLQHPTLPYRTARLAPHIYLMYVHTPSIHKLADLQENQKPQTRAACWEPVRG